MNTNKLPAVPKAIGGISFVFGLFAIPVTNLAVQVGCYNSEATCVITTWIIGLSFIISYFVAGWGILRRSRLAWLFIIPLALLFYSSLRSTIESGWTSGLGAWAFFLIHLIPFSALVAKKELYGFKTKEETTSS